MSYAPPREGLVGGFNPDAYTPNLTKAASEYSSASRGTSDLPDDANAIDINGLRELIIDNGAILSQDSPKRDELLVGTLRVEGGYTTILVRKKMDAGPDGRYLKYQPIIREVEGSKGQTIHEALVRLLEAVGKEWRQLEKKDHKEAEQGKPVPTHPPEKPAYEPVKKKKSGKEKK